MYTRQRPYSLGHPFALARSGDLQTKWHGPIALFTDQHESQRGRLIPTLTDDLLDVQFKLRIVHIGWVPRVAPSRIFGKLAMDRRRVWQRFSSRLEIEVAVRISKQTVFHLGVLFLRLNKRYDFEGGGISRTLVLDENERSVPELDGFCLVHLPIVDP